MSVFKDNFTKTWACKFRYTNFQGETKQFKKTGFSTKKEAEKFEHTQKDKLQCSSGYTFQALFNYYIEDCSARFKPTTVRGKQTTVEKHILPFFKDMKIDDISTKTIRTWQTQLLNNEKNYSQTYLKTVNAQLSAILNFAVRVYGLKQNPCSLVGRIGKPNAEKMQFWTIEEFDKFISVFDDKPMEKAMFYILFFGGLRRGEMLALYASDFDFTNNTISVSKNYAHVNGEDLILTPKTESSKRIVSMPPMVMSVIRNYIEKLYQPKPNERVFPCSWTQLRREMNNGIEQSGVKKIRVHDLRHSHASMLMNMNVPIKQISERLGHTDIKITLGIYAHLYKEKEQLLVDKLQEVAIKGQLKVV